MATGEVCWKGSNDDNVLLVHCIPCLVIQNDEPIDCYFWELQIQIKLYYYNPHD